VQLPGQPQALGAIGPAARDATEALLATAEGRKDAELSPDTANVFAAAQAAAALGTVGAHDPKTVATLMKLAADPARSQQARCGAAWGLGLLGPKAAAAVPALLGMLEAPGVKGYQEGRYQALKEIEWPRLPEHKLEFFATDPRGCALLALARIGTGAAAAATTMGKLYADASAEPFERWAAAEVLAVIGPAAAGEVERLARVLRDERTPAPAQVGVVHALAVVAPRVPAALAAIKEAATDGDRIVRLAAVEALREMKH